MKFFKRNIKYNQNNCSCNNTNLNIIQIIITVFLTISAVGAMTGIVWGIINQEWLFALSFVVNFFSIIGFILLAYLFNQKLSTSFIKASYSLDFENKNNNASFSIYEHLNTKFSHNWFLIANQYKKKSNEISSGLFDTSDITTYLIPEKSKVDFFLKLEGDFEKDFIVSTVNRINKIDQVITSYTLDPNVLKSKDFLIF